MQWSPNRIAVYLSIWLIQMTSNKVVQRGDQIESYFEELSSGWKTSGNRVGKPIHGVQGAFPQERNKRRSATSKRWFFSVVEPWQRVVIRSEEVTTLMATYSKRKTKKNKCGTPLHWTILYIISCSFQHAPAAPRSTFFDRWAFEPRTKLRPSRHVTLRPHRARRAKATAAPPRHASALLRLMLLLLLLKRPQRCAHCISETSPSMTSTVPHAGRRTPPRQARAARAAPVVYRWIFKRQPDAVEARVDRRRTRKRKKENRRIYRRRTASTSDGAAYTCSRTSWKWYRRRAAGCIEAFSSETSIREGNNARNVVHTLSVRYI